MSFNTLLIYFAKSLSNHLLRKSYSYCSYTTLSFNVCIYVLRRSPPSAECINQINDWPVKDSVGPGVARSAAAPRLSLFRPSTSLSQSRSRRALASPDLFELRVAKLSLPVVGLSHAKEVHYLPLKLGRTL